MHCRECLVQILTCSLRREIPCVHHSPVTSDQSLPFNTSSLLQLFLLPRCPPSRWRPTGSHPGSTRPGPCSSTSCTRCTGWDPPGCAQTDNDPRPAPRTCSLPPDNIPRTPAIPRSPCSIP